MYKLQVKNPRGETLTLTDNPNYNVFKIEGLTPPQATVNTSANSTTDGVKINSARVGARNIIIYMTIEGNAEANRLNLYKYFPVKKSVELYFKNGSRNVSIDGTVELIECDLFSNKQVAQISIICPKAYFKSVDNLITEFGSVTALFSFPFSIPANGVEFSSISTNVRPSIVNIGDVETGLIIDIYAQGTVVNPIIYDVLNKTYMKINYTMITSDHIVINTNAGEKGIYLVRDGVTTDILGYMALGSEWLMLDVGDNIYTHSADSGVDDMSITFTTPLLYYGV